MTCTFSWYAVGMNFRFASTPRRLGAFSGPLHNPNPQGTYAVFLCSRAACGRTDGRDGGFRTPAVAGPAHPAGLTVAPGCEWHLHGVEEPPLDAVIRLSAVHFEVVLTEHQEVILMSVKLMVLQRPVLDSPVLGARTETPRGSPSACFETVSLRAELHA